MRVSPIPKQYMPQFSGVLIRETPPPVGVEIRVFDNEATGFVDVDRGNIIVELDSKIPLQQNEVMVEHQEGSERTSSKAASELFERFNEISTMPKDQLIRLLTAVVQQAEFRDEMQAMGKSLQAAIRTELPEPHGGFEHLDSRSLIFHFPYPVPDEVEIDVTDAVKAKRDNALRTEPDGEYVQQVKSVINDVLENSDLKDTLSRIVYYLKRPDAHSGYRRHIRTKPDEYFDAIYFKLKPGIAIKKYQSWFPFRWFHHVYDPSVTPKQGRLNPDEMRDFIQNALDELESKLVTR